MAIVHPEQVCLCGSTCMHGLMLNMATVATNSHCPNVSIVWLISHGGNIGRVILIVR